MNLQSAAESNVACGQSQCITRAQIQPSYTDLEKAYQTLKTALANRSDRIQAEAAVAQLDQVLACLNSTDISL